MSPVSLPPLEAAAFVGNSTITHPLPLHGQVTLGRGEDNDIRIDDPSVSRRHAVLHIGRPLRIVDAGSANGIRVTRSTETSGTARIVETRLAPGEGMDIQVGDGIALGAAFLIIQRARAHGQAGAAEDDGLRPASSRVVRSFVSPVIADDTMKELYAMADRVAQSPINVLLLGETGVGKEVMAEAIHRRSPRVKARMVCLNCAALSESLFESELFGHEAGAFTGALRPKTGLLETAEGGTVFLDEVGELPLTIQAKLLRVIEEKKILRVGGIHKRQINVRFVSATNRDLAAEVQRGAFRQDLFFRLNGFTLTVPPLRERVAEIVPLARHFLARSAAQMTLPREPVLSREAVDALEGYAWPGNIRELRNVIERALILCTDNVITAAHLGLERISRPQPIEPSRADRPTLPIGIPLRSRKGDAERQWILEALDRCAGNQTQAAELLGMSRRTLVSRLDLYGISRPRKRS